MIVICINGTWKPHPIYKLSKPPNSYPVKDCLYEVTNVIESYNTEYYELREIGNSILWKADHFREVDINIEDIEHVEVLEETI